MVQINLRLNRVLELLEAGSGGGSVRREGSGAHTELLLDLIEAAERTLESAASQPAQPPARAPWWRRWLGGGSDHAGAALDLDGLRLAVERSCAVLGEEQVRPIRREGPVEPRLHQVIEVAAAPRAELDGHIARTWRRGWVLAAEPPVVLRVAQVTAWRHDSPSEGEIER